jgi:hypothetical protein
MTEQLRMQAYAGAEPEEKAAANEALAKLLNCGYNFASLGA